MVRIRMVLARKLAIRPLDLRLRGVARDTQDLIQIFQDKHTPLHRQVAPREAARVPSGPNQKGRKGKNPLRPPFHYSLFQFEADFNQACPWSLNSASTVSPSDEDAPALPAEAEASEVLGPTWPAA